MAEKQKRVLTEEQKQVMRDNLARAREAKQAAKATAAEDEGLNLPPQEIEMGEPVEIEEEADDTAQAEDGPPSPFSLFLASLDDETRELIPEAELAAMFRAQEVKEEQRRRAERLDRARARALETAQIAVGAIPGQVAAVMALQRQNAEMVTGTIELPPSGDQGEIPDIGLRIDQKVYLHGRRYPFTRAQWDSMREIMYRAGESELLFKGQNKRQRGWIMGRATGATNAHIELNQDGSLA
jgi:hypothetical protein